MARGWIVVLMVLGAWLASWHGTSGSGGLPSGGPQTLLVQPDGKVVVAGWRLTDALQTYLLRLNRNGTPDQTFGQGGLATVPAWASAHPAAMALQADGKLIVVGSADSDILLQRFLPNGALDPDFGYAGVVLIDVAGGTDWPTTVMLHPDGRILVAGSAEANVLASDSAPGNQNALLLRYLPDGTLDPTFGEAGKVLIEWGTAEDEADALLLEESGALLVSGRWGGPGPEGARRLLARYHANGSPDATFGEEGRILVESASGAQPSPLLEQEGRIVLAELVREQNVYELALWRFTSDGVRDPTFGEQGRIRLDVGDRVPMGIARQADGKLLVGASSAEGQILVRLLPSGQPDLTFGTKARARSSLAGGGLLAAMHLAPDDHILIASSPSDDPEGLLLARYLPDGQLDPTFGDQGLVRLAAPDAPAPTERARRQLEEAGALLGLLLLLGGVLLLARPPARLRSWLPWPWPRPTAILLWIAGSGLLASALLTARAIARQQAAEQLPSPPGGARGALRRDFGGYERASDVAILADGRLLLVGSTNDPRYDVALVRYLPDGTLDPTFDGDGIAGTDLPGVSGEPRALLLLADGRFVLLGQRQEAGVEVHYQGYWLARYLPNGTLDPSFGQAGVVQMDPEVLMIPSALLVQPDGHLVVAGTISNDGTDYSYYSLEWIDQWDSARTDYLLARHLPDGSPDLTFGTAGQVRLNLGMDLEVATTLALQDDGRLLVGGYKGARLGERSYFTLLRLLPDGQFDTTFGSEGRATAEFLHSVRQPRLVKGQAGMLLLVGEGVMEGPGGIYLAQFLPEGTLDQGFGYKGRLWYPRQMTDISDIAQAADGSLLIVGRDRVASLHPSWALDVTFGEAGMLELEVGVTGTSLYAGTWQADGKPVLAGSVGPTETSPFYDLLLLRLLEDGRADPTFGDLPVRRVESQPFYNGATPIPATAPYWPAGAGLLLWVLAGYYFHASPSLSLESAQGRVARLVLGVGGLLMACRLLWWLTIP